MSENTDIDTTPVVETPVVETPVVETVVVEEVKPVAEAKDAPAPAVDATDYWANAWANRGV
jgi:hypothetical protein